MTDPTDIIAEVRARQSESDDPKWLVKAMAMGLADAADALCAVGRAIIAVEPTLKQPYPDAPEHSPWTRFAKEPTRRAYNLGRQIGRDLKDASAEEQPDAR